MDLSKKFLKINHRSFIFFFFFHIIVPREIWFGWFSDFSTFFRTKFLIITRYLVKYNVRYRINRRMNALKKVVSVMQAFSAGYPFKKIFLIKFKPSFHPRVHFFFCVSAQASARSWTTSFTYNYLLRVRGEPAVVATEIYSLTAFVLFLEIRRIWKEYCPPAVE